MAATAITPVKLTDFNKVSSEITTATMTAALDATDGGYITPNGADEKMLVLVQNTNGSAAAKTVTFKAGTGIQGVNDYAVEIAAGKTVIVALESGRFKIMSGTNKGKIHLTGAADLKVAAFTLP